jgi:hypothetical protein
MASLSQAKGHLSPLESERLRQVKEQLFEVEIKSLSVMIKDLEKTNDPSMNLTIKEAMAQTYLEIVQQEHVQGLAKKQWLYSMVALNMAYLQFSAGKDSAGSSQNLNKLIRQKLKSHLPSEIFKKPGFHYSIE